MTEPAPMPASVRRYLESLRRRAQRVVDSAKRNHLPVDATLEPSLIAQLDEVLAKHPTIPKRKRQH